MFSIKQLRPLLEVISRTQAILIGGQAVNLWSERYKKDESPWSELQPFTSVDVHLLGTQPDAKACADGTDGDLELPQDPAHTPNAAKVHCRRPSIDIDVLHTVNGLNTADASQTAVSLRQDEIPLRVLHPVLCLESKTVNLLTLDQSIEGRQDEKHLRLSIANCREFLKELTLGNKNPESLIRWAERIRIHSNSQAGLDIQRKYALNFQEAVPVDLWAGRGGPFQEWAQQVAPRWRSEVQGKLNEVEEIQKWIETLQRGKPEIER